LRTMTGALIMSVGQSGNYYGLAGADYQSF
jgi:hypothetical protein